MRLIATLCAGLMAASPAFAQERDTLGMGRLFTNDYFGDGDDRWRTGSYSFSIVRGPEWTGRAPDEMGAILEYRLRSEIIAPARLNGPESADRAYVGSLSAGVHTHFTQGAADVSLGVDAIFTGPQTGLDGLQDWFHGVVGAPSVAPSVSDNQVPNALHLTATAEASYPVALSDAAVVRPFVQARYGIEESLRVGADVIIGQNLQNDLWLRDSTSGQLYSGVEGGGAGTGYVFGFDYAAIGDSAYFPASFGTVAENERLRVRAGVHSRFGEGISFFYGLTYLSEEYVGQPEGQVLGSLKLNFNF